MTDLPSAETVRRAMSMKGGTDRHMHAMTLLELAAEGRLFDRETLDYEAFRREFWGAQIPNREYEERAHRALLAALGGSGG